MKPVILHIASEDCSRTCYSVAKDEGYELVHTNDLAKLITKAREPSTSIVVVDASYSAIDPLKLIPMLLSCNSTLQIVCLVDASQSKLSSLCLEAGAIDYLIVPFLSEQFRKCLRHITSLINGTKDMIATAHASRCLLQMANRVACTDATVLLLGASGTGKEKLARFIHNASDRKNENYVAVNCAALPEQMLEGILFGHNKGAFTGAISNQIGKFEAANGGTLLLDEISEMPLALQAKLLRVIQEREVERLGSNSLIKLDVRIIAASNKDLKELVQNGEFREDLYYRLNVLPLTMPSLAERRDDILPLIDFFINRYGNGHFTISEAAAAVLTQYNWPGNIRELENVIQRAVVLARGSEIQTSDLNLPVEITPVIEKVAGFCAAKLKESKQEAEYEYIRELLVRFKGKRTDTAKALGMTTRALRYKIAAMKEHGIEIPAY